jgi:hypothetical protein
MKKDPSEARDTKGFSPKCQSDQKKLVDERSKSEYVYRLHEKKISFQPRVL